MLTPPYWCWLRVPLRWIGCKVKKVFPQSWTVFQSLFYFALQENRTEKLSQKSLSRVASFDGDFFEKLFPATNNNLIGARVVLISMFTPPPFVPLAGNEYNCIQFVLPSMLAVSYWCLLRFIIGCWWVLADNEILGREIITHLWRAYLISLWPTSLFVQYLSNIRVAFEQ